MNRLSTLAATALLCSILTTPTALAAGAWIGGQDILHVPMSWCIVDGSPADTMPNINGDTDTDAVIWRRHERPTDNIFIGQAGISLRSAINNAWGSFNFPIIADPDISTQCGAFPCVTQSDIRGEDVNVFGAEFNAMMNACDTAYNNIGKAGIGVTAVNLGVYHDSVNNYVGVVGWGGCSELPAGTCIAPYDGLVGVIDNRYLFPSSPNRQLPGNNPSTGASFIVTDPFDQLTAHEVGHALSLNHRNNVTALMNPTITDNSMNGQADNIGLNNAEVTALRANALNVPGLEIDPPGVFNPGEWLAQKVPSGLEPQEDARFPPFLDVAGARVVLDKGKEGTTRFELRLGGLLPQDIGAPPEYWFLVDGDGRRDSGCQREQLAEIGVPLPGALLGTELIAFVEVVGTDEKLGPLLEHKAWHCLDGKVVPADEHIRPFVSTFAVYPHFAEIQGGKPGRPPVDRRHPIHDIIHVEFLPHDTGPIVKQGVAFNVEVLAGVGQKVVDIGGRGEGEGLGFLLDDPDFPHCFPPGPPNVPGEKVQILVEDFGKQNGGKPIHGLLGPIPVFNGFLDADGNALIDFPVPAGTTAGPHLVTIGIDNTALTGDCTLHVAPEKDPDLCPGDFNRDGFVDRADARIFSLDFGRKDCRIQ